MFQKSHLFAGSITFGLFLAATTAYVQAKEARPNIAGMETGITLNELTAALPKEVSSVKASKKKLDVTYFGTTSKANMHMTFVGVVDWRFRKPNYDHVISATVDPRGIITSIDRTISYDVGSKNPPVLDGLISSLHQKYGKPQQFEDFRTGLKRLHWWIGTGEAKSNNSKPHQICPHKVTRMRNGLDWITGVKAANGLEAFAFNYGEIGADCGFIIRAEIKANGPLLRSLNVMLIDVQQVHKTMRYIHFLFRDKSIEAEIKLRANSGAAPEL